MTSQTDHIRKINKKYIRSGKGKKDRWVGQKVGYKGEVYIILKQQKNGLYIIKHLNSKKRIINVNSIEFERF